jgi:hypothetical protein
MFQVSAAGDSAAQMPPINLADYVVGMDVLDISNRNFTIHAPGGSTSCNVNNVNLLSFALSRRWMSGELSGVQLSRLSMGDASQVDDTAQVPLRSTPFNPPVQQAQGAVTVMISA